MPQAMEEQWHVMNVYGQKMIGDYAILYELVFFKEFNKVTKKKTSTEEEINF